MSEFEELNIKKARDFHSYLLDLASTNDEIKIDMSNIKSIDASCIQLLISCKKSCEKQNKRFVIENISEEVLDSFTLIGADLYLGV